MEHREGAGVREKLGLNLDFFIAFSQVLNMDKP